MRTCPNTKIFSACKELEDEEYKKDRKAFFCSIHNTLNHLLLVDRAYISRIEGKNHGLKRLDQILYDNLYQLEKARKKEDKRLVNLVNNLTKESTYKEITYQAFDESKQTYTINLILFAILLARIILKTRGIPIKK